WKYPSGAWIKECEKLIALEQRVKPVLQGEKASAAELLSMAELCHRNQKRYGDAVALYELAFAADASLAENLDRDLRFHASTAAAADAAAKPDSPDAAKHRDKARAWLDAHQTRLAAVLDKQGAGVAIGVARKLELWRTSTELAVVREPDRLMLLADAERR